MQGNLMMPRKSQVGEEIELRLDLVNIGNKPSQLVKIEGVVPPEFKVVDLPSFCSLQNGTIQTRDQVINGFEVETIKLKAEVTRAGSYEMRPEVFYVDDLGMEKGGNVKPVTITVQPVKPAYEVLSGRVTTGFTELDVLLYGGIPEHYAVALTSPSTNERELLIRRFLETGAQQEEIVFDVTADAAAGKELAEKHPNFYFFICNPQADTIIPSLPNVYKLKGIENLTEIDIALTKAFRALNPKTGSKRICLKVTSDILLHHHAVTTKRWLNALLPTLKSEGFTILAVVDPQMHPTEELQAVLSVFDGEIRVTEKETPEGVRQTLRVRKLVNQKYLEKEIALTKEKLSR